MMRHEFEGFARCIVTDEQWASIERVYMNDDGMTMEDIAAAWNINPHVVEISGLRIRLADSERKRQQIEKTLMDTDQDLKDCEQTLRNVEKALDMARGEADALREENDILTEEVRDAALQIFRLKREVA